jgi:Amt family ammonium transporter
MIVSITGLMWAVVGYSLAFTGGTSVGGIFGGYSLVGGLSKAFMSGVTSGTYAATFSNNVYIPELSYFVFQMTFAMITPALFIGSFAERIKFWPLMLFTVLWSLIVYYPIAHMVWYWAGPDFLSAAPNDAGFLYGKGALDFAGGTVVHINAGIAGLVGCLVLGKRLGFGKENTPPHSLTMTMIGASLLWVGWFGFNAGSNLESNGVAAVAFVNTMLATCAAALSWAVVEQIVHKKPSMLGAASGAVAGLVAITPASGFGAPMTSIVLGLVVSPICFFFVSFVKNNFKYDDTLDVFGVHCIGGITGALATGIVANPALGGQGWIDYTKFPSVAGAYDLYGQMISQLWAIGTTLIWSGGISAILLIAIDKTIGLRPTEDAEREGLDLTEHGERAYNM